MQRYASLKAAVRAQVPYGLGRCTPLAAAVRRGNKASILVGRCAELATQAGQADECTQSKATGSTSTRPDHAIAQGFLSPGHTAEFRSGDANRALGGLSTLCGSGKLLPLLITRSKCSLHSMRRPMAFSRCRFSLLSNSTHSQLGNKESAWARSRVLATTEYSRQCSGANGHGELQSLAQSYV